MRGDIILLDFPFAEGGATKLRSALVVQSNSLGTIHTIVAQIMTAVHRRGPTRFFIDPSSTEGLGSGLRSPSIIVCEQLYTVRQDRILRTIGSLSAATMAQVNDCLKAALELP